MYPCSSTRSPFRRLTAILLLSLIAITGFLVACVGQQERAVEIRFELDTGAMNENSSARDLRFYLHDVQLLTDRQAHTVKLRPSLWQSERVALIDLVGTSATERNASLHGSVTNGDTHFTGLGFTLGVPFDLNHANPLLAAAPLNRADLFWTWASGYKFMRVDLVEQGPVEQGLAEPRREWSFHLGSTGCSSASALRPPALPCAQPNLVRVELRGFDPTRHSVHVKLSELVSAMNAAHFAACTGDYQHNPACAAGYGITGLDVASGTCRDAVCKAQRLFGVE